MHLSCFNALIGALHLSVYACRDEHDGNLEVDLGNLAAYDPIPIDASTFAGGTEDACRGMATRVMQALTRRLFDLPSEPAAVGRIASLPPPTTVLPREKPVPKPRPPTKWEVFAQKKGIVKVPTGPGLGIEIDREVLKKYKVA